MIKSLKCLECSYTKLQRFKEGQIRLLEVVLACSIPSGLLEGAITGCQIASFQCVTHLQRKRLPNTVATTLRTWRIWNIEFSCWSLDSIFLWELGSLPNRQRSVCRQTVHTFHSSPPSEHFKEGTEQGAEAFMLIFIRRQYQSYSKGTLMPYL